jgi:DNA processing protein
LDTNDRPYAFWLVSVPWIGQGPVPKILNAFDSPREAFLASDEELIRKTGSKQVSELIRYRKENNIFRKYDEFMSGDMKLSFIWDEDYPERLKNIPDPPLALFYYGKLPENNKLSVAIIGARQCSPYGVKTARELGEELGKNDINVISGMAFGIDGISQKAVIEAGGYSYAVLGCGADICYPDSNSDLYEMLKENGGILSTYPPGTPATSRYFPPRNRIVSGLSDAIVVIEARTRSGTLITVDMALDQGRDIYAVPGRLDDELSAGCNGLIGHGAKVYLSPKIFMSDLLEDHLSELESGFRERSDKGLLKPSYDEACDIRHRKFEGKKDKEPDIEERLLEIYRELTLFPQSAEEIDNHMKDKGITSPGETGICLILMELCLEGYAVQISPGCFCRK